MKKIQISNQTLWDIAQNGDDIDQWLRDNVGIGNWTEWIGLTAVPYRCFSFKAPVHETLFVLKWL